MLNLYYLLQVNFWKQANYMSTLIFFLTSFYSPTCFLIFSPHFGLISFLHSLIFSMFFFFNPLPTILSFPSLLLSFYRFFSPIFSLSLFFHQEKMLVEFKNFRLQFYFWGQQECWENFKFFTGKRKSNNKRSWFYQDLLEFSRMANLLQYEMMIISKRMKENVI